MTSIEVINHENRCIFSLPGDWPIENVNIAIRVFYRGLTLSRYAGGVERLDDMLYDGTEPPAFAVIKK